MGAGAFAAHLVDVEVDPDTGKVPVLRYTAVQDVGTAIHPSYVEGQMQGGVVQGIGWALNEEYYYDDNGRMANSSFLDYRMPTALDVPMIDTIIVEVPAPTHPVRRARRRRSADRPAARRHRERHLPRDRRPPDGAADVATPRARDDARDPLMPTVRLFSVLQPFAGGASTVEVTGETLRAVIDDLDRQHPGLRERVTAEDTIRPDVMIAIGADEVRDLDAPVPAGAEVHLLPAIAGG